MTGTDLARGPPGGCVSGPETHPSGRAEHLQSGAQRPLATGVLEPRWTTRCLAVVRDPYTTVGPLPYLCSQCTHIWPRATRAGGIWGRSCTLLCNANSGLVPHCPPLTVNCPTVLAPLLPPLQHVYPATRVGHRPCGRMGRRVPRERTGRRHRKKGTTRESTTTAHSLSEAVSALSRGFVSA